LTLAAALENADVLLVGEMHNDPLAHLLEAELLRTAVRRLRQAGQSPQRAVALSLEMFERDVQIVLDEYLAGLITEKHFLSSSRPWNNYETDYRPLVELAREHQLHAIAANAPARYVTRASRAGADSLKALSPVALGWLPPLPFAPASAAYAGKFAQAMGGGPALAASPHGAATPAAGEARPAAPTEAPARAQPAPGGQTSAAAAHGSANLLDAQNLRDATMAYAISEHLKRAPGAFVFHVNGRFHSEERLGVTEHLLRYRPTTRVLVVTIVSDRSFPDFDAATMARLGDYVIVTDPRLTRTF
jgi:uncharacterized iron-regulated protein